MRDQSNPRTVAKSPIGSGNLFTGLLVSSARLAHISDWRIDLWDKGRLRRRPLVPAAIPRHDPNL
jgi:hypothetical protein